MSQFEQRRQQVLTPALEGSKVVQPANSLVPFGPRPSTYQGREMFGPLDRGSYPGGFLRPLRPPYMSMLPPEKIQVPTLLPRHSVPYAGPPALMPYWGGHSIGRRYIPGFFSLILV